MAALCCRQRRHSLLLTSVFTLVLTVVPLNAQQSKSDSVKTPPECSLGKTNKTCKLILDRTKPIAPPAVQMYSGQALTVIVKNPKLFERYFLDYQSGQAALSPDVASSIVQALLPALGKASFHANIAPNNQPEDHCSSISLPDDPGTLKGQVEEALPAFQDCLTQLSREAMGIYPQLEPFVSPDSIVPGSPAQSATDPIQTLDKINKQTIEPFLETEFNFSGQISAITGSSTLKSSVSDATAMQQLSAIQKLADAVGTDLKGYSQRIDDLQSLDPLGFGKAFTPCASLIAVTDDEKTNKIQCVKMTVNPDDENVYRNMTTRTITYALNALNLVAYSQEGVPDQTKKRLLASIPLNFADSPSKPSALRWEGSAGAFFSSLPVRSFSAAPVFTGNTITDTKITQNVLRPTIVPFAAANYRLSNDLGWTKWKSAIYWTGAVGVNPNTVSADFASGLSVSWRGLMFSPLWHFGHDVRLTQGLHVGQSLGAGFKGSLPTQTYWTSSFALGISVRVPSLTGR